MSQSCSYSFKIDIWMHCLAGSLLFVCLFAYMYGYKCESMHTKIRGNNRTTWEIWLLPSTSWVSMMKFRSLSLGASSVTCCVILSACGIHFYVGQVCYWFCFSPPLSCSLRTWKLILWQFSSCMYCILATLILTSLSTPYLVAPIFP